jgi:hypothetical protein
MYELLKSQKNVVFEVIQANGLEPADFSWGIGKYKVPSDDILTRGLIDHEYEVPRLTYKNSQFFFQFGLYKGGHHCTYSPGSNKPVHQEFSLSWSSIINRVVRWLNNLKRENEAPDLWAEMGKYKTSVSLTLPEQVLNEPISAYEAERIADKLQELANKIEELFQLTKEQNQFVRSKLTYLADAAKRQRSIDWVHTSIGVFATIAMGLALEPEQAKKIWELMKSIVGFIHLIGS